MTAVIQMSLIVALAFPVVDLWHQIGDPLAMNDDMRLFVEQNVSPQSSRAEQIQQLYRAVFSDKKLGFQYDKNLTLTVQESFEARRGNCVSFSMLFWSLADYAGIPLEFQEIVGPLKRKDGRTHRRRHINLRATITHRSFDIDFPGKITGRGMIRLIDRNRCLAHYYNNLAVEAVRSGMGGRAVSLVLMSFSSHEQFAPAWVTLGVCYKRAGLFDLAERAYRSAIDHDRTLHVAVKNLAVLLFNQQRFDEAEGAFPSRRGRNPYYFFNKALNAHSAGLHASARAYLEKARDLAGGFDGFINMYERLQGGEPLTLVRLDHGLKGW